MRAGVRIRLVAFVVLSVVGLLYVGSSYLGFLDRALGRGYTVHVLLPTSGGLFEGSEVTYRGVKIGQVTTMAVQDAGLRVEVALEDDAQVPADAPVFVHNLSAVGEQYLDFQPGSASGPWLEDGDTVHGTEDSLPTSEEELLTNLNGLVSSLDGEELNTVVTELGDAFRGNASPLRSMVDDAQAFIETARQNEQATFDLLDNSETVLRTQAESDAEIRSLSRDLAAFTGTLADSDADLRTILERAGPTADELVLLVETLDEQLPPFLTRLVSVADVLNARLPALEQLLVTFPRLVAAGPSALTPGEQKFGRVNLNLNFMPEPCTDGYLPPGQWRSTAEEDFMPFFDAECDSGAPVNMRGMKHAPPPIDWRSEYLGEDE
ncbi:MCE family protein [Aeromicrobium sp. CTD01-1L150]|uniref:MCE family protein n=1 Tax=Aeromicrobium sp. CTD01-1L150 TaxID=3341830 RepID=UPI0035C0E28D